MQQSVPRDSVYKKQKLAGVISHFSWKNNRRSPDIVNTVVPKHKVTRESQNIFSYERT